jgi:hypothetical protein
MFKAGSVILVGGAMALLAGCGSSSSSSSSASSSTASSSSSSAAVTTGSAAQVDAAYAAKADAICTTGVQAVAAIQIPGDPAKAVAADLPKWSTYFDQVVPIVAGAGQQLAALSPPTSGGAGLVAAATKQAMVLADIQKLATAAKAGSINDFDTALLGYAQDNAAANAAFDGIGLRACGSGTSAATSTSTST